MSASYKRTQVGYGLIAVLGACVAVAFALVFLGLVPPQASSVAATLAICLLLFSMLTVQVDSSHVRCAFALGVIRKDVPFGQIVSATVVRNHWIHGWGIRWIPGGWLWNVSGLDAVELQLSTGKVLRIGTDEPAALQAAITAALGAPGTR
jgi:hypothetical protein